MGAAPVIRMPAENNGITLAGQPMVFLVTGKDTKHTSMFDWTIPAGFATGLHIHRVQEETSICWKASANGTWAAGWSAPRPGLTCSSPERAAQYHQRQQAASPRAHDRLSTGTRAPLRRACETGRAGRASGCESHR